MALDFRLLNSGMLQQPINTVQQFLEMQQRERMQGKQIASQESQFLTELMARQQEGAANRATTARGNELQFLMDQQKLAAEQEQQGIENEFENRRINVSEMGADTANRRLDFDIYNTSFEQGLKMANELRQQDAHAWQMFDNEQKQKLKEAVGVAYKEGGYQAAADVMGQMGLPGEAMKLLVEGVNKDKTQVEIRNAMLQGQNTLWDIKEKEDRHDTLKFNYALSSYVNTIAGTKDPGLQYEMMYKANEMLADKFGVDQSELLKSPEGQKVFLQSLMEMGAKFNQELGYKTQDPQKDFITAQNLEAALGPNNPYFKDFSGQYRPKEKSSGVTVNLPGEINKAMANVDEKALLAADAMADSASKQAQFASTLAGLAQEMQGGLNTPGLPAAEFRTAVSSGLNALGIKTPGIDASPAKMMQNLHAQLALSMRPAGSGAMSDVELETYMKKNIGQSWDSDSAQRAAEFLDVTSRRAAAYSDFYRDYMNANNGSSAGLRKAWNQFTSDNKLVDKGGNLQSGNADNYQSYLPGGDVSSNSDAYRQRLIADAKRRGLI